MVEAIPAAQIVNKIDLPQLLGACGCTKRDLEKAHQKSVFRAPVPLGGGIILVSDLFAHPGGCRAASASIPSTLLRPDRAGA